MNGTPHSRVTERTFASPSNPSVYMGRFTTGRAGGVKTHIERELAYRGLRGKPALCGVEITDAIRVSQGLYEDEPNVCKTCMRIAKADRRVHVE